MQALMTPAVGTEKPWFIKKTLGQKVCNCMSVLVGLRFVQAQSGRYDQEMAASGESKLQTNQPEINRQCHR